MNLLTNEQELIDLCSRKMHGALAVLYGGWSAEREISLLSGRAVLDAFAHLGLEVEAIDVDRDIARTLQSRKVSHSFNALHGPFGEDGVLEGLLQLLGISSTSSGVLASALAMDKLRSKQLWLGAGVSTPDFVDVSNTVDHAAILDRLGGAVMVKPCHEGSSLGMSIARDAGALRKAIQDAKQFDTQVLAEQYIDGPEYSIPIVCGNVLPTVQLKPKNEFYDYEAKYFSDETEYECPASLASKQQAAADQLALRAYETLGCSGWARVDLMQSDDQEFYVLEVNTVPGMTTHSIVPMSAAKVGVSFPALVLNILLDSLESRDVTN